MSKGNKEEQKWLLGESLNQYDRSLKEELNKVEKRNREQNHKISALINAFDDDYIKKEEENTNISLDYSKEGIVIVDDIKGNTLVNNVKDSNKELVLNGDIDTSGYGNVTLTEGINGGKVDVICEGNTMVNVCDQEDPIAITKNYEVTTGNHIALQGEYDGKCRPNIYGNTLVNLRTYNDCNIDISDKSLYTQTYKSNTRLAGTVTSAPAWVYINMGRLNMSLFKPNTKYTVIFNKTVKIKQVKLQRGDVKQVYSDESKIVNNKAVVTTVSNLNEFKFSEGDCIYCYLYTTSYPISFDCEIIGILEGDYTNKPIPDYFTGMQSSFEDKLVPENLYKFSSRDDFYLLDNNATLDGEYITMTANGNYQNAMLKPLGAIKPSTIYTVVVDIVENTLNSNLIIMATKDTITQLSSAQTNLVDTGKTGIFTYAVTTSNDLSGCTRCLANFLNNTNTTGSIKYRIMVVEGDYTNYDFTNYDSTKGGKYKIDYKITGKNKFDKSKTLNGYEITDVGNGTIGANLNWFVTDFIPVIPNTSYKISGKANGNAVLGYNENKQFIANFPNAGTVGITIPNNVRYIKLNGMLKQKDTFQIGEGDTATTYEPYKEFTKTLYLNSPLLKGDTIEQSGNDIVHMHRYNKVVLDGSNYVPKAEKTLSSVGNYRWVFAVNDIKDNTSTTVGLGICDKYPIVSPTNTWNSVEGITQNNNGHKIVLYLDKYKDGSDVSKQALIKELSANPITFIYELQTPTKEVISTNDNLLLDSYVNGHLDVDSVVPIDKVVFQSYGTSLKYLSPNTEYTIQFESDSNGKLDALALNSSDVIGNLNIVKGVNNFNITTSDKITINYLWTTGIGFNASKIVVTPKVDQDFGYFKAMKSVGQNDVDGHKIEILSSNSDNTLSNKKEILMNEPLRGLPNGVRDKYVMIDGKWYIERNTIQLRMDSQFIQDKKIFTYVSQDYPNVIGFSTPNNWFKWNSALLCDNFAYDGHRNISAGSLISNQEKIFVYDYIFITLNKNKVNTLNEAGVREYLKNNPIILVGQNTTPTYEPIDYNPFEVYSDITHISNNSAIPCNMVIKNSGYNCILKPNTLYTIALDTNKSGTIGMNLGGAKGTTSNNVATITTPETLTDNTLRLYGKGIKSSKVRLLEGDKTNWIPSHFEGMKSCFEDKLQEDGKYKMEILSNNKNLFSIKDIASKSAGTGGKIDVLTDKLIQFTSTQDTYTQVFIVLKLKPFTKYKLSAELQLMQLYTFYGRTDVWDSNKYFADIGNLDSSSLVLKTKEFVTDKSGIITIRPSNEQRIGTNIAKNIIVEEGTSDGNYVPHQFNKIQFLLDEPLRAVGNVKDKVYVKEDKIVVQRNCGSVTFDGSDTWNLNKIENNIYTYSIRSTKFLTKMKVGTWETLMNNKCYIIDKCGTATTSTPKNEQLLIHNTVEDKFIWYSTPLFSTVQSVKQYLNDNPFKILYQLAEPVYEEVEYSSNRLTLDSYDNSTLIYDTNIPVSNTSFKPLWEELVYVKNSTTYYIQFNAIGNGDVVVNLGGTELSATITEGYNKIEITTPNESTNLLTIDGQGIKISKVVVSEALCGGYYKGLQSCFEEHMENGKYVCVVRGISLDGSKVNGIKFYLNEPLRGIGDIKDKLCIKDNKLMVERNFIQVIIDGENLQNYNNFAYRTLFDFKCNVLHNWELANFITDSKFSNAFIDYQWNHRDFESIAVSPLDEKTCIDIIDKSISFSIDSYKNILKEKPIKVVYQLLEPIYEEITNEYGLPIILEGYENGIVYVDSAITPTTSIKYTSNNTVPTTLSNIDNLNTTTQDDINNNIVTYMMDIDMMLTEMEMEDNASIMSLSDSDDNNQKPSPSHNNILDRMNKEDRIKYQDNTTKMLEKVIKGKSLTKEENINRIDLYLSEGKIREEQSNYLKELLKEGE